MIISLVVAIGKNRQIGFEGKIPWPRLKLDMENFKELTIGHYIVMGRKTWESIGSKPLKERSNIILSRNPDFTAEGAHIFPSISPLFKYLMQEEHAYRISQLGEDIQVFIIGGQPIYEEFLRRAKFIYLTEVDVDPEADAFFPEFDETEWEKDIDPTNYQDEKSGIRFRFVTYTSK